MSYITDKIGKRNKDIETKKQYWRRWKRELNKCKRINYMISYDKYRRTGEIRTPIQDFRTN